MCLTPFVFFAQMLLFSSRHCLCRVLSKHRSGLFDNNGFQARLLLSRRSWSFGRSSGFSGNFWFLQFVTKYLKLCQLEIGGRYLYDSFSTL